MPLSLLGRKFKVLLFAGLILVSSKGPAISLGFFAGSVMTIRFMVLSCWCDNGYIFGWGPDDIISWDGNLPYRHELEKTFPDFVERLGSCWKSQWAKSFYILLPVYAVFIYWILWYESYLHLHVLFHFMHVGSAFAMLSLAGPVHVFLNIFFVYVMLTCCLGITFPHVESICSLSHYAQGFVHPMWCWHEFGSTKSTSYDWLFAYPITLC